MQGKRGLAGHTSRLYLLRQSRHFALIGGQIGKGASIGTSVKSVWIAEDVGNKAPPNYKIDEKTLALPFSNTGSFTLSEPNNRWPVGSYRLEIYIGSTLANTLKFTVKSS